MAQVKIALAALAAACGGAQAKKGFDSVEARVRIAAANRSAVAAERAEKARFARLQKDYSFCTPAAAEVYMSEDGRSICGLSDEEPVAEYRLVQFPQSEWNELADLCWKALRSGCLCVLGLESAPQLLESALDQERDLGNVAESVKGAILGKLRHARAVLTDPAVREWLPEGDFKNIDAAYVEDFADVYEKALRSLVCQDVTRDDVDALLRGNAALDGILGRKPLAETGLWAKSLRPDAAQQDIEREQLNPLMSGIPADAVRVMLYGSDESCWAKYWDVLPDSAEAFVKELSERSDVKDGHERIRVACTLDDFDIGRAPDSEWLLAGGRQMPDGSVLRFVETTGSQRDALCVIDALESIGWLEQCLAGNARIQAFRRTPETVEKFFDSAQQVVDKNTLEAKSIH